MSSVTCENSTNCTIAEQEVDKSFSDVRAAVRLALISVTPVITAFGLLANSVNMVVLTRRWMRTSTNFYLSVLALCDMVYLTLYHVITLKFYPGMSGNRLYIQSLTFLFPLANLFSNFATWLTCLFTFERWLVISHPLLGRKHCTRGRAKQFVSGLFALTLLFTLPNFLEYTIVRQGGNGSATYTMGNTEMYALLKKVGYYHMFPTVFTFGPLLFLAVFNALLIRSVVSFKRKQRQLVQQRQQQQQQQIVASSSEQQRITRMLIAVVLLFCLCQLPSAFVTLRKAMAGAESRSRTKLEIVVHASVNLLLQLNAASNFVLYSCFSTKFRATFRRIFLGCRRDAGAGAGDSATRNASCGLQMQPLQQHRQRALDKQEFD